MSVFSFGKPLSFLFLYIFGRPTHTHTRERERERERERKKTTYKLSDVYHRKWDIYSKNFFTYKSKFTSYHCNIGEEERLRNLMILNVYILYAFHLHLQNCASDQDELETMNMSENGACVF